MAERATARPGRIRLAWILAAALVAVATAAAPALAVVGGSPDNGAHPYVGMAAFLYYAADAKGNPVVDGSGKPVLGGVELCSGSLVSRTVFVTAAHCVPPANLRAATRVTFVDKGAYDPGGSGDDALHDGPYVTGTPYVETGFCPGCAPGLPGFDTHDVAVVQIDPTSIAGYPSYPTTYAQLPTAGEVASLPHRATVDIVGYGLSALGERMTAPADVTPGGGRTGDEFLKLSSNQAAGKGATCSGDSGGPDLLTGTSTMLAIGSFGPNATCKAVSYSQRMDTPASLDFVRSCLLDEMCRPSKG